MSGPCVSVLLPVRDGAPFLREALDSVLAQTLSDFELVVVDDGSEDETPTILGSVEDERLRVLRQERLGLVTALSRAVAEAHAPLLARMDADDVSLPERLERQVAYLDARPEVGTEIELGAPHRPNDPREFIRQRTHRRVVAAARGQRDHPPLHRRQAIRMRTGTSLRMGSGTSATPSTSRTRASE